MSLTVSSLLTAALLFLVCVSYSSGRSAVAPTSGGLRQRLLHQCGDVRYLLRHADAGLAEAADFLGGGVLLALDDRAGMAEAHAGHRVHETPGHEGGYGQAP